MKDEYCSQRKGSFKQYYKALGKVTYGSDGQDRLKDKSGLV